MAKNDNLTDFLIDLANTIREKKGIVGTINPQDFANEIASIESGSSIVTSSDVNFYDYDGTILHSYTKEEFAALTSLPDLPTREGLTCQGWNYTLDEAKSYVADYGSLNIGAMYITSDGATKLYISIIDSGRMTVPLYFNQTISKGVLIDWGDGAKQVIEGTGNVNTTHIYEAPGDYIIQLIPSSQCRLGLGSDTSEYCLMGATTPIDRVYCNMLKKVELGINITGINAYAFSFCCNLKSINLPNSITYVGSSAFDTCYSLTSIVIPQGTTTLANNAFYVCRELSLVSLPSSVTSLGEGVFSNCYALKSINIPELVRLILPSAFEFCYSLTSLNLPSNLVIIGDNAFSYCQSLVTVTINSAQAILSRAFYSCYSLVSVFIKSNVSQIGENVFYTCCRLATIEFSQNTAVPNLANTNALMYIAPDCKIKVPENLLNTWKSATNWVTYESQIFAI